ncbi:hypothetical protein BDZ45DRAFT_707099 [Acephala macrosclerotiorum]|nr:hypothetical protein BDZ45DRAFT_707099 [Acephala macrosclerotiorum]
MQTLPPPTDWQLKTPGSVLKVRKPHNNITIRNAIDTFQVQYRTIDTHSNVSWAVSTQFIPALQARCNATHVGFCAHGIVSYEIPYDSADPDATPSYLLQWGEPYGEMSDLLARGWFVSVPNYEGPLPSYCARVQSGHATLDSHCVVEGGTVPNITTIEKLMNGKDTAGLLVAGLVGITSQHTEARQYILSRLKDSSPYNVTGFLNATTMSGVQALINYIYQDAYSYFLRVESDLDILGFHGTPNMPMFIYKAIADEMSAVNETDALADNFFAQGVISFIIETR